jgi:hypothetical protein
MVVVVMECAESSLCAKRVKVEGQLLETSGDGGGGCRTPS